MRTLLSTLGIGFVSGLFSGAFGIGGGIITTPAIRLLLGAPALVAVGTPLPVIFPSAITGAIGYVRKGSADVRAGLIAGLAGSLTAILGAWATRFVGGTIVLLATAALIVYTAGDMLLQGVRQPRDGSEVVEQHDVAGLGDEAVQEPRPTAPEQLHHPAASTAKLVVIGAVTGLYAGFLGLGGGFILVPMLTRWLGFGIKRAIGTSLVAIAVVAIPATATHALLGHIDWRIAAVLAVAVVPGAWLGARLTLGAADRSIRLAFAALLIVVGVVLAVSELGVGPQ